MRLGPLFVTRFVSILASIGLVQVALAGSPSETNLIPDPGLESTDPLQWLGSLSAISRVASNPHSGTSCLHISERSESQGQGNSPQFSVRPGQYYVEAWLRVDPDSPGLITCDVPFQNQSGKYLAFRWVGVANSLDWTLVRGVVHAPEDAVSASIRIRPTGKERGFQGNVNALHGACFADDFYFTNLIDAIEAGRAAPNEFVVQPADDPTDYASAAPMRPHLYVTARKVKGLLSLAELREAVKSGHRRELWEAMKKRADEELLKPPIFPSGGANYIVCNDTALRILRHSLAFLITQDERYKQAALEQIAITYDTDKWPRHWRDDPGQPKNLPAGLRVGQLCAGIGLAYDWLHSGLTDEERRTIVEGLDKQGIQPFIQTVQRGNWQVHVLDNFMPAIVGGVGIAGMGLAEDHPDSATLVKVARQRMKVYLNVYGPEGEWNESVGYSGSTSNSVEFYTALRYWTTTRPSVVDDNTLGQHPLPQFYRWRMYMTLPHGREAKFGNCDTQEKINTSYIPAVASAARDGVLQWFYWNHRFQPRLTRNTRDYMMELLTYDPSLETQDPEGRLPHGHAFQANTMCVSSRTDWDPISTPCVVYGKGGAAYEVHGHHDMGQVCIDGHGEPLIVEQIGYGGGYKGGSHDAYRAAGHNVLVLNDKDMIDDRPISRACFDQPEVRNWPALRASWVAHEFDDRRGGYWVMDTTDVYEDVEQVRRAVVHLNPGVVVVLDTAILSEPGKISLNWHTSDKSEPQADGRFLVGTPKGTRLSSRVVRLDDGELTCARREHPSGASFVESTTYGRQCSLLSLFCVFAENEESTDWQGASRSWSIKTSDGRVEVELSDKELSVQNRQKGLGWSVPVVLPTADIK